MRRQDSRRPTSLLIDEPPLQVLPSLAVAVGLNEAIFLQQLHYWLLKSGHAHDGRRWVYNTYAEWLEQFPFWSTATLRRVVGALEEKGIVVSTTAYNRQKVDRTKWYAIDYDALARLSEPADHVRKVSSPSGQGEQMDVRKVSRSVPETIHETTQERRPRSLDELERIDREQRAELKRLKRAPRIS